MSINEYLKALSSNLIIKDNEKESIIKSVNTLKHRLNLYFECEIEDQFYFGSYIRGTILPRKVDESSDIDYMIVFNNNFEYKPETFLKKLKNFAKEKYKTSEIYRDSPTIVLELNHIKFELVPAYLSNQYYIPAPRTSYEDWMETNPDEFNIKIKNKNIQEQSIIKPLIRLLKYWNAINGHVYNSYKLENHIINQNYLVDNNLKDYFYTAVDSLITFELNNASINKVNYFKNKVKQIKNCEEMGFKKIAESELKILLPPI